MRDAPELAVVIEAKLAALRWHGLDSRQCQPASVKFVSPASSRAFQPSSLSPSHSPRKIGGGAQVTPAAEPANPIVRESCCLALLVAPPGADWRASETRADLEGSVWRWILETVGFEAGNWKHVTEILDCNQGIT